ncbi:hypothetical protein TTHERM_00974120 (macronuclear) [Tetrahymena thermophila SB210]|uniref:Uncharacterized protein n=1 Tax=Tetrahymena thermophila (strain SB210) TaxID=312017 RepID=Q22WS2_TETTS|nr:hypothetical protein TTHERM_00974120 [Tetrahymena thermophila SB210]EAR89720.1 hypothetical protein TTHERM_00974120 [Tetrahymena thermophila SB210]|eukprot:XP_001009965.1 hypothetical protein TTHERM_00974120 [Tetrahymena thermophila SB210]
MQNKLNFQNQIDELIKSSLRTTKQIIIEQSIGSIVFTDLTSNQQNQVKNVLQSLSLKNQKLLIESIDIKDEANEGKSIKQVSFKVKYSLKQFNNRSVCDLIKNELKADNCTIVPNQKLFFEGQKELRHLLQDDEMELVKQNEEQKQKLLSDIQSFGKVVSTSKKEEEENNKLIEKLTKEKDELKAKNLDFQKEKNLTIKINKDLVDKTKKLVDEIKEKEKIMSEQDSKVNEILKKIEENQKKMDSNEKSKQLVSDIAAKDEQIMKQQQLTKTLQNELQTCKNTIKSLQQQIETLETKISDQEISNLDYQKDIFQLSEKINVYDDQIKQYDIYLKQ